MNQYRTRLILPDFKAMWPWDTRGAVDGFFETIESVGWTRRVGSHGFTGERPKAGVVWVYLEAEDLYELAMKVRELEDELNANFGSHVVTLERPVPVRKQFRIAG